jgi:hypothetical protein
MGKDRPDNDGAARKRQLPLSLGLGHHIVVENSARSLQPSSPAIAAANVRVFAR